MDFLQVRALPPLPLPAASQLAQRPCVVPLQALALTLDLFNSASPGFSTAPSSLGRTLFSASPSASTSSSPSSPTASTASCSGPSPPPFSPRKPPRRPSTSRKPMAVPRPASKSPVVFGLRSRMSPSSSSTSSPPCGLGPALYCSSGRPLASQAKSATPSSLS